MYRNSTFEELIEYNNVYSSLAAKLEIPKSFLSKSILDLSQFLNLNIDFLQNIIKSYDISSNFRIEELDNLSINDLLFYLKKTHRYYLNKKLPEIEQSIIQLFSNKTKADELLLMFCFKFNEFKNKLIEHISFEEKVFFNYVESLNKLENEIISQNEFKTLYKNFSSDHFLNAHSEIENELEAFSVIIGNQKFKTNLPLPFRIFLNQIENFQIDMQIHAMIEDDILLQKVVLLEKILLG